MSLNEKSLLPDKDAKSPKIIINDSAEYLCYGCSKQNPIGLKLDFTEEEGVIKGKFTPDKFHQGWPGYTHGGILFSILDEAGGYAVRGVGVDCVTAKSEIKYIKPAVTGKPIYIIAKVTSKNKRLIETEATLSHTDGSIIARNISQWCIVQRSKIK